MTPTHVELVPGEWALWPDVAVRSAGFPADDVLRLVSPRAASAATKDSLTAGCRRSMAATSPGSIRYPRILT